MQKTKKTVKSLIFEKENIKYMELSKNEGVRLNIPETQKFSVTKEEFKNFIKNSEFKNEFIIFKISVEDEKRKNIALNFGFSFEGIEFNPETEEIQEIYTYRHKEELFIKDTELKEILEKLEIEGF